MVEKARNPNQQSKKRLADFTTLIVSLAIIMLANFLSSYLFGRFDLTSEKRYTLSENTITQLENLEDVVFVRVYLEGNLPTEFRELLPLKKHWMILRLMLAAISNTNS
jgi:ABC-2 type transport system permease protein